MRGEEGHEAFDAAILRLAAGNPEDVGIAGERAGGGVGIGRLGIVDEAHGADAADLLHAMRETGEIGDGLRDGAAIPGIGSGRGISKGCVLPVVAAWKMRREAEVHHLGRALALRIVERAVDHEDAAAEHLADRHRHGGRAAVRGMAREDGGGVRVVDADHDLAGLGGLLQEARLHGGVVLEAAMAVDVVRRDVGKHRDVGHQAGREIDLVGRKFQHIDRLGSRRVEVEHRLADIAADLHVVARRREDVADQGGGGRLAVGAGYRDHRAAAGHGGVGRHLAREQLHVADDVDAGGAGAFDDGVGFGMRQRHAGREHQRLQLVPRPIGEGHDDGAEAGGFAAGLFLVVPGIDMRAAGLHRRDRRHAAARQAEDADVPMREGAGTYP
ncbi:MAG: hypothetical protein WDM81_07055 [Rhizomicrobium sp.]